MGAAERIRASRIRAGKSRRDVAEHLGLNEAWYQDLEQHDDELAATLTIFQGVELASFLGVRLQDLMTDDRSSAEAIALLDLPSKIDQRLAQTGVSFGQFEEEVGWDLEEFLKAPLKVAAESPIIFLQELAQHLDIDWLSLIPDEDAV